MELRLILTVLAIIFALAGTFFEFFTLRGGGPIKIVKREAKLHYRDMRLTLNSYRYY
jgi:hypothetical protein